MRFRSLNLKLLHEQFLSENADVEVSLSHFSKHFPTNTVVIPSAEDWGTAGCSKCLKPRFKVEALNKAGCTTMSSEDMCEKMKVVPTDTDGTTWNFNLGKEIPEEMRYMKWVKVDAEGSSVPIDRKVAYVKEQEVFKAELVREPRILKDHITTLSLAM